MQYNFPETRFAKENTAKKQRFDVMSKSFEAQNAINAGKTEERIDEKLMDLLHSLETYFRGKDETEGEGTVDSLADFVYIKNERSGHYSNSHFNEKITAYKGCTQTRDAHLGRFVDEMCEIRPEYKVTAADIYECYQEWESGQWLNLGGSQRLLGKYLTARFEKTRAAAGYIYHGIGIKA